MSKEFFNKVREGDKIVLLIYGPHFIAIKADELPKDLESNIVVTEQNILLKNKPIKDSIFGEELEILEAIRLEDNPVRNIVATTIISCFERKGLKLEDLAAAYVMLYFWMRFK